MNAKEICNNEDLFNYLVLIGNKLKACNHESLGEEVIMASQFAIGSASEFLHEAQIVLMKIEKIRPNALSSEELQDIQIVIKKIKVSFRNIGGA